jgi:hypothetical protein
MIKLLISAVSVLATYQLTFASEGVSPVLTTIMELAKTDPPSKAGVEKILNLKLQTQKNAHNEYFDLFEWHGSGGELAEVDVRIPKARGGAVINLTLRGEKIDFKEIDASFGTPKGPLEPNVSAHAPTSGGYILRHQLDGVAVLWTLSGTKKLMSVNLVYGR